MNTSLEMQDAICPKDSDGRPRLLVGGDGAWTVDAAGERWIDFDNARGSVTLGHGHPTVAEAISRAAAGGVGVTTGWSPLAGAVIDRLQDACRGESIGLFRSGTAAVRAAVSAARASMNRPLILSAGYHGYDSMWNPAPEPFEPNADGVIDFLYDLQVLADRIKHEGHRVAAVVVSVDLNLGRDWYERLQAVVQDSDIPLVLDEVKSGFRYRHGLLVGGEIIDCAAWVVSKGIANGAPIAAVGGDRKLLAAIRDMTYTSFFEPVCLAAAEATLSLLQSGTVQATVLANGNAFIEHARTVLNAADVPIEIVGAGPMFQFVCANEEIEWEFYAAASRARLMFYEGDHQAPSAALSGETLTTACDRFDRAVSDLAGRWSGVEVTRESRYQGAWNEMCGLPDFPRTPEETQAWARTLLGF